MVGKEANMKNMIRLSSPDLFDLPLKDERYQSTSDSDTIPKGLVQWIAGTQLLNCQEHGFALTDIACVRAFWSCASIGFSSAGFVVETVQGQRFYLRCATDDDKQPSLVAITAEVMPAGRAMPEFGDDIEPLAKWSDEVGIFNVDLIRAKAGNAA
jgi:hypothetical protein